MAISRDTWNIKTEKRVQVKTDLFYILSIVSHGQNLSSTQGQAEPISQYFFKIRGLKNSGYAYCC